MNLFIKNYRDDIYVSSRSLPPNFIKTFDAKASKMIIEN